MIVAQGLVQQTPHSETGEMPSPHFDMGQADYRRVCQQSHSLSGPRAEWYCFGAGITELFGIAWIMYFFTFEMLLKVEEVTKQFVVDFLRRYVSFS